MKGPTKKLKTLATRYRNVTAQFNKDARAYVRTADNMPRDRFWDFLEHFATGIQSRMKYGKDPVKEAAHNTILEIKRQQDTPLAGWTDAARFLATYQSLSDKLSDACWDISGVDKGDDSYGDWVDSLVLAGKTVVEDLLKGALATYWQVAQAVEHHADVPAKFIMNGENYIKMMFEDELIKHFSYAVYQED